MFCCSSASRLPAGFGRVAKDRVIAACNKTLHDIYAERRENRRNWLTHEYERKLLIWRLIGRFLFLRKPTMRDAIYDYINSRDVFTPKERVELEYAEQEGYCKRILRIARVSEGNSIWISEKTASMCGM